MGNKKKLQGFITILLGLLVLSFYLYKKRIELTGIDTKQTNQAISEQVNIPQQNQPVQTGSSPSNNSLTVPTKVGSGSNSGEFKAPVKVQ